MNFPGSSAVKYGLIASVTLVVAYTGVALYDTLTAPKPAGSDSVIAIEAPAVAKAPTAKVEIKAPVRAYRGQAKANLKLPAAVAADPHQEVIAASQVKSDLRPQTISTVVNTETGAVQTFVKTDPYPWFAIETRGELRMGYGYKYSALARTVAPVGRLHLGYDVVRVKALTIGVTATVDTDREAFVGVGVSYKF